METYKKKLVTMLTAETVSILTQQVYDEEVTETIYETQTVTETETVFEKQTVEENGETKEIEVPVEKEVTKEVQVPKEVTITKQVQVGSNHRCAYSNTISGRNALVEKEPEHIVAEVMAVWGYEPTIEEPEFDDTYVPEPTLNDIVNIMLGLEG